MSPADRIGRAALESLLALLVGLLVATPLRAATLYQTNLSSYDPRIDLRTDGVLIHMHGHDPAMVEQALTQWQKAGGTPVYRMWLLGSDAGQAFTSGKVDGQQHGDAIETGPVGDQFWQPGRPHVVPTAEWNAYMRQIARHSIEAGAAGIVPEEPLAHARAGYSLAFRRAWEEFYGEPWQPPHFSVDAYWKASKLKSHLFLATLKAVLDEAREHERAFDREIEVLLATQSLLSHAAGSMIFASGAAARLPGLDGLIGQVSAGPIGWSLGRYEGKQLSRDEGFFETAWLLYSSLANLTRGTGKRLFLLSDPAEDDPYYSWDQYRLWYNQSLVAQLMFPEVTGYEVIPWPERVFLPGYETGGGSPGPAAYLTQLMVSVQALADIGALAEQSRPSDRPGVSERFGLSGLEASTADAGEQANEGPAVDEETLTRAAMPVSREMLASTAMPAGTETPVEPQADLQVRWHGGTRGIGALVGDSLGWQRGGPHGSSMDSLYGLVLPLLRRGIPVEILPVERIGDAGYLDPFRVLLVSYDMWKPLDPQVHQALADWVQRGGVVLFFDGDDAYNRVDEWWHKAGYNAPVEHLFKALGLGVDPTTRTTLVDVAIADHGATGFPEELASSLQELVTRQRAPVTRYVFDGVSSSTYVSSAGEGAFVYVGVPSALFAVSRQGAEFVRQITKFAVEQLSGGEYREDGVMLLERGPYTIAYSIDAVRTLPSTYVNLLDPDLPVAFTYTLQPGEAALLYDVGALFAQAASTKAQPKVLYASRELLAEHHEPSRSYLVSAGPWQTQGIIRLFAGSRLPKAVHAYAMRGYGSRLEHDEVHDLAPWIARIHAGELQRVAGEWEWDPDSRSLGIKFDQWHSGVMIVVEWE